MRTAARRVTAWIDGGDTVTDDPGQSMPPGPDEFGVLDHGQLVEWGSHEELMAREGLYFHLNMVQVEA